MDTEYRKHYRDLFLRHWWWRARTEYILRILRDLLPATKNAAILDVGCGEGLLFDRLSKFGEVEGIELEAAVPPDSPWRNRIHFCPFDDTFQPGKQYSLILMLDVLEHLSDPLAALRNVRRLLKPDGVFLATVPAFQSAWTNHDVLNEHFRRYTKSSFDPLVKGAGLRIIEQRYFFHWTFLAKLGVRAYQQIVPQEPKVPTVPPGWINASLYGLSRFEHWTLGHLPVPFGSSLLVAGTPSLT